MSTQRTNPWAGLASYQDPETADVKLKFCGRDKENYDVTQLIDDNICVTLYGKSGMGKTSLLNAGVFPRLRHRQYLPVSIRLSVEARESSFQRCIVEKVSRAASSAGSVQTFDVVSMPSDEESIDYLWHFFARSRFVAADGRVLFPVMVFDQFEEVFRGRRDEADVLLRQIHFMMDESHTLPDRLIEGQPYGYDFNFRFVLSLREDDLYRLEDSIDNCYLPEMKRCRYRLRSLSDNAARDVVLIPGEGLFRQSEQDAIASTIIDTARNKEDHTISTNILSLICSRIFVEWQRSGTEYITPTLVEAFVKDNPFERFYNEATRGCSNRDKIYIEEHFVDSEGRRNSIPEKDLQHNISNWRHLLEGDNRILQRVASTADSNGYRVELLHDSFCEPLLGQKAKRVKRRRWIFVASSLAAIFVVVGFAFYISDTLKKIKIANNNTIIIQKKLEQERALFRQDSILYHRLTDSMTTEIVVIKEKYETDVGALKNLLDEHNIKYKLKSSPVSEGYSTYMGVIPDSSIIGKNFYSYDDVKNYIFTIQTVGYTIELDDEEGYFEVGETVTYGGRTIQVDGWIATGFLLNNGKLVTARRSIEGWYYYSCFVNSEWQILLNLFATQGAKVAAVFTAVSPSGQMLKFTSNEVVCNRSGDHPFTLGDQIVKLAGDEAFDARDFAWLNTNLNGGLAFDTELSEKLPINTQLEFYGFPHGWGENSATQVSPIKGSGVVAKEGLENGLILLGGAIFESGHSGSPALYKDKEGKYTVVGVVSAKSTQNGYGFIVPISRIK